MANIVFFRGYRSRRIKPGRGDQAQLNRQHPLARGLVGYWVLNEGGATLPRDLVSGHVASASTNVAWAEDIDGVHLDFTGTLPHIDLNHRGMPQVFPPCCLMVLCDLTDAIGAMMPLQTNDFDDGSNTYSGITFQFNTSTNAITLHYGDGGVPNSANRLTAARAGLGSTGLHHWGFNLIPPDTALTSDAYKDGVRSTITPTTSGTGAGIVYQSNQPFGKIGRNATVNSTGKYYFAAIWNRTLSDAEHASMAANPWQVLKGARRRQTFLLSQNNPSFGTLTLAGQSVKLEIGLSPTSGTLTLAGVQAQVAVGPNIAPTVGQQIRLEINLAPIVGVLSLAGVQVSLNDLNVTPSAGTLGLAGQPISLSIGLRPGTGILTLSGSPFTANQFFDPKVGTLGLAGGQVVTTGPTNIRISQILVEYLGSDGVPIKRQLNAHYDLDSNLHLTRQLNTDYDLPDITPLQRSFDAHYDLPDIKFIPRFLNEQYNLNALAPLTRQLNTDYEIPIFASVKRQLVGHYGLPIFAPFTRHLDTDYDLPIFASRTRHFDAHYDLPDITSVIRQLTGEYNLNAFLPAFRSLDGHYDLQVFLERTRQLDGHYDLQAALDHIRQLNEQYILPDGTGVTRQLQAEYILNAFLPLNRQLNEDYGLQAFQSLRRNLDTHYDLQAFVNFTRSLDAHYQLPDGLGFTRQLSDEYILNAFLPVLRQLDGHYDLQAFQTIQRALDAAYELNAFDAVTRQLGALYDLQAFVARKRLLNEEYDLQAFIEAQRLLDGHYDLQAFVGVTRHLDEEYDLQTFLERIRQLNGHYDLQAFQDAIRHLNGEYDLQVYAQLCRHLNDQYLLDAAQVFYTWLMNLTTNAPSRYEQFPFHSMARFNQEYFGARADGIYRLDAAKDRNDITGSHTGAVDQATALVDSAATFVTKNIRIGEVITNDTDGSSATVVARLSETALTTSALTGGTDNDWDTGDTYTIEHLADIAAFADTGKLSLGTNRLKRVPQAFLGEDSDGTLKISFVTDNGNTHGPYNIRTSASAIKPARAKFARGIKSRYWEFKLENKDGASLLLDKVQLEVEDYQSRVK